MADFVPIQYGISLRITGQHTSGKKVYNLLHCSAPNAHPTATDVQNAVTALGAWVSGTYKGLFHSSITITELRGRSIAEEPAPVYIQSLSGPSGGLTGDQLPLATAQCAIWTTGLTGYSHRGRFFVFPADETVETNGLFTAGYVTGVVTSLELLIGGMATAGYPLSIASYRLLTLIPITDARGNVIPGHLRSRRPDKGI